MILYTVVWEKFVVGNIHEKKFSSVQATDHYKLLYLFVVTKFRVFNFCHTRLLTKIFSNRTFPKLRYA